MPRPWSATSRYGLAPAPGALGLAQDLLNTAPAGHEPDLLADLASARTWVSEATGQWSAATGLPVPEVVLRASDLQMLRTFRDDLREVIAGEHDGAPDTGPAAPDAGTAVPVLHVPSIGLVAAGDVAYNGVHQYILEGGHGGLQQWLRAIDRVADLHPRAVVAGHKNKNRPDDPAILDETRRYLTDVIRLLDAKPTAREFFDQVIALYPDRLNPSPVWYGALALLGK